MTVESSKAAQVSACLKLVKAAREADDWEGPLGSAAEIAYSLREEFPGLLAFVVGQNERLAGTILSGESIFE